MVQAIFMVIMGILIILLGTVYYYTAYKQSYNISYPKMTNKQIKKRFSMDTFILVMYITTLTYLVENLLLGAILSCAGCFIIQGLIDSFRDPIETCENILDDL